jgi:hypothetical protein
MAETIKTGTVLIKDGTFLPDSLRFETEPCVTGWRLVKDLDGYGLGRKIHDAGWTFFCQAAEIKASVFGIAEHQMVRRAIERILGDSKSERFNALEITQVTSLGSERFPVVRYLTVSAHSRHIQESLILFSAKDPQKLAPSGTDWEPACEEFDSRLVLLAARELTPDEEADVADHLAHCPRCTLAVERERELAVCFAPSRIESDAVLLASCRSGLEDALDTQEERSWARRIAGTARIKPYLSR